MPQPTPQALLMAGIPQLNSALYHRIRFLVGDPGAYVQLPTADGQTKSILILRDIEMERARRIARADEVACPRDFTPPDGLSGDRETATAQAAAECLRRAGVTRVVADRTLPLIFADLVRQAGIGVECDTSIGVADRRRKDPEELRTSANRSRPPSRSSSGLAAWSPGPRPAATACSCTKSAR